MEKTRRKRSKGRSKYVVSFRAQKGITGGTPHKRMYDSPDNLFLHTGMKYSHIIDEPVNPGHDYFEYVEIDRNRTKPMRKALMKKLRAERKERIKKFGRRKVPKMKFDFR